MVIEFDLELEQIGVKRIFLFGEIDETILMRQPGGFEIRGNEDYVCKL